jgi:hypothetical protein
MSWGITDPASGKSILSVFWMDNYSAMHDRGKPGPQKVCYTITVEAYGKVVCTVENCKQKQAVQAVG